MTNVSRRTIFMNGSPEWAYPQPLRLLPASPVDDPIPDQLEHFGRHRLFDLAVFRGRTGLAMLEQVVEAGKFLDRKVGVAAFLERLLDRRQILLWIDLQVLFAVDCQDRAAYLEQRRHGVVCQEKAKPRREDRFDLR